MVEFLGRFVGFRGLRVLVVWICALTQSFGLEFSVNSGREGGRNFAVINLRNATPFACWEEFNRQSEVSGIICRFDKVLLSRFQRSETLLFAITPEALENGGNGFALRVTPKAGKKLKLYNTAFDLSSRKRIPIETHSHSKRWQILGYEGEEIPFLNDKPSYGINFPIRFDEHPSIGVLDVQMRPMENQPSGDRDHFLRIQSLLEGGHYREVLSTIREMLALYPDTIFKRDVLYMRLVALDGINQAEDYEEILALSKAWFEAYPTDIHASEVLFILAKTYAKMRFFEEAKYYYNRLFDEYKGDKYELLARLDYAEHLSERGDHRMMLEMYETALNEAKDLEVASLASVLLGDYYRKIEDKNRAEKFLEDVLEANPSFFTKDPKKYSAMMRVWAESGIYQGPARVFEILFEDSGEGAESLALLKDMAMWFDKAGDFQKAHQYYQRFLEDSKDESDKKAIKMLDDLLLLNDTESDVLKRLEHYDYVIATYKGGEEEKIALEKKAQTYYDMGDYSSAFAMREDLEEVFGQEMPLLINVASVLTQNALSNATCKEVAYYGGLYAEKLMLKADEFLSLFDCLYVNRQFVAALQIAKEKSAEATTPQQKESWLYRLGWVEYASQNYPKAALAARDTLNMLSNPNHHDSAWVLFMALSKVGNSKEAFTMLPRLEELLGNDTKMIEVYRVVLRDVLASRDDVAIKVYAQKLMDLQERYQRYEYSPWAEFAMVEALGREGEFEKSLEILNQAQRHANNDEERVRIYYLQGYAYEKLGDDNAAVESYKTCEAFTVISPWKNLCIEAKNILQNTN